MTSVAIFGMSWHGRTVLANFYARNGVVRCVFVDDGAENGKSIDGISTINAVTALSSDIFLATHKFIVCIGDTAVRSGTVKRIMLAGGQFAPPSIHPSAILCHNTEIGDGTSIMPGAVIGTGVRVGHHCVINNLVSLGHATIVKDGASVNDGSHTCGGVVIGQEAHIGIGVSILNNVRIGDRAIVGLGAVVIEDVPADVTVAGGPAKIIKHRGTRG